MAEDRSGRKQELLEAARNRLVQDHDSDDDVESGPEIRYRGQVLRTGRGLSAPGAGSVARQSSRGRTRAAGASGGSDDVREALEKIKALYKDGLISRAEAERKRSEILDRL